MKGIVTCGIGMIVGFAGGFLAARQICIKHYSEIADAEIESVKEEYKKIQEKKDEDMSSARSRFVKNTVSENQYEKVKNNYHDPHAYEIITFEDVTENLDDEVVDIYYDPMKDEYLDSDGCPMLKDTAIDAVGEENLFAFGVSSNDPNLVFVHNKITDVKYAYHRLHPGSTTPFDSIEISEEEEAEMYNNMAQSMDDDEEESD